MADIWWPNAAGRLLLVDCWWLVADCCWLTAGRISTLFLCSCVRCPAYWLSVVRSDLDFALVRLFVSLRSLTYSARHWLFGDRWDLDFAPLRLLVSLGSLLCSSQALWCSVRSRLCSFSVVGFARIVTVFLHWLLGVWSDIDFAHFRLLVPLGSLLCCLLASRCSVRS